MLLLTNGKLITRNPEAPFYEDGAVAISGETVADAGDRRALMDKYPDAEPIDACGGIIMPGLINAHTHIYSALARGLSIPGYNPTNFFEVLDGMWWKIDRRLTLECTRASALATITDCIKQGVTTIFDHHASFCQIPGSLFEIAEISQKLGMRSVLCYETSDRDGPKKRDEAIKENADFAKHCAGKDDDMLRAMFGGHALFTLSDATLDKMLDANSGMTGFHIHVAEGLNDVYDSMKAYGTRPVNRLLSHGILGERTILGHCIHITPAEMDIIRETNTMVVNNPQSNMGNAVGCSPVLKMFEKGILVGLGTDAYTNDMLESVKAALAIQRHNACVPNVGWCEATGMLFKNNARIGEKYFKNPIGVIKPGAAADVIVMDYKPFTPLDGDNIDGHMLFGMTGRQCRTTIINGKILMRDRELAGTDEDEMNARICQTAKKLWSAL